jgi:hypothetical protein
MNSQETKRRHEQIEAANVVAEDALGSAVVALQHALHSRCRVLQLRIDFALARGQTWKDTNVRQDAQELAVLKKRSGRGSERAVERLLRAGIIARLLVS